MGAPAPARSRERRTGAPAGRGGRGPGGGARAARALRPGRGRREHEVDRRPTWSPRPTSRPSATIRELLARERPDDAIMGEEGDDTPGTSGLRWIVDPLDGTINYLYGHPQWCISVACEDRGRRRLRPGRATSCGRWPPGERADAQRRAAAPSAGPPPSSARRSLATGFGYAADDPRRAGGDRRPGAAAGARHAPGRQRRARPGLGRGGPPGRLLRARREAVGHRRRHAALHGRSGLHVEHAARRPPRCRPASSSRRPSSPRASARSSTAEAGV